MNLRPDEIAALQRIEKSKREDESLNKGLNLAGKLGTAAIGIGAASKIFPFLNDFIPVDLAVKGISKISPELGKFLKKGQSMGLDLKQGLDFLKNKLSPQQTQSNPIQEFETNYPDLAQALSGYINQGQTPQAAAAILKTSSAFGKKIKDLEKNIGKNFVDYVLELFGSPQQSQIKSTQTQVSTPSQQQQQSVPNPQQQSQSKGIDPQLLQLMNGIRSAIQNIRGTP
jgi:hypothetical protein